jgi:alpha-2-macroglobulin
MRTIIPLFCGLFISFWAFGQNPQQYSSRNLVYRVSNDEARKIFTKLPAWDSLWLHTPVQAYQSDFDQHTLPPGHYLFVRAQQEKVVVRAWSNPGFTPLLLQTRSGVEIRVTDTLGQPIRDAVVTLGKKSLVFDAKTQTYRLKKRKKGGIVEISVGTMTAFYELNKDDQFSPTAERRARWSLIPLGRLVMKPRIKVQYWRYKMRYGYGAGEKIAALFRQNRPGSIWLNGYAAFSKPIYRPGDTLEVKFWVTDPKGRPWNKPATLRLTGKNKKLSEVSVLPEKPGVFTHKMPLGDSLTLDQNYYIQLRSRGYWREKGWLKRRRRVEYSFSSDFRYEDYVLDELVYTATQGKDMYTKGDTVRYRLSAFTTNQQPVPDGTYSVVVMSRELSDFGPGELYLPDTLWRSTGHLAVSGYTDLAIPPRFFPEGNYDLQTHIYFLSGSGEMKKKELSAKVKQVLPPLEANAEKGWLTAHWNHPDSLGKKVVMRVFTPDTQKDTVVNLPFLMKIRPEIASFRINDKGNYPVSVNVNDGDHGLVFGHQRLSDTLVFAAQNPQRVPLVYRIFRRNTLLSEGTATDSTWTWSTTDITHDYTVYYAYTWAGERQTFEDKSLFFEKALNVSLEAPVRVEPGEIAQIKVSVTNPDQRPIAGADITAGGYNSQFGDKKPYSVPRISNKKDKIPRLYPLWEDLECLNSTLFYVPLSAQWYHRLALDTIPFYQLRKVAPSGPSAFTLVQNIAPPVFSKPNPAQALPPERDSFFLQQPQFSPFVINNHVAEPVYMVWVDEMLVYYYGATQYNPYSFYGKIGRQNIRVRTPKGEFFLDNVHMKAGKKYHFSLCANGWSGVAQPVAVSDSTGLLSAASVRWQPRPDSLTRSEQEVLRKTMLQLRPSNTPTYYFFWNSRANIRLYEQSQPRSPVYLGPLEANSPLQLQTPLLPERKQLNFEPGFEYDINDELDRLYQSRWPAGLGKLPAIAPEISLGKWALAPHNIPRLTNPEPKYAYVRLDVARPAAGNLRLHILTDTSLLGVSLMDNSRRLGLFSAQNTDLNGIFPGRYTLVVYTKSGKMATQTIFIRPDTTLCLRWKQPVFRAPNPGEAISDGFQPLSDVGNRLGGQIIKRPLMPNTYGWGNSVVVSGIVRDPVDNEPLIGALVRVFQGDIMLGATMTDVEGKYRVNISQQFSGVVSVQVSYTGYSPFRYEGIVLQDGFETVIPIEMMVNSNLQEVVIMGYGLNTKRSLSTGGFRDDLILDNISAGNVSLSGIRYEEAVNIKGSRNTAAMYYVDGIRVSADSAAQEPAAAPLRSNFNDLAYFQPRLSTDEKGEAVFRVRFPDDITAWEQYAIATGGRGQAGFAQARTRALKTVSAQLAMPRFAVAGDRFDVAGRATNASRDSLLVKTRFLLNNVVLKEKTQKMGYGMAEFQSVTLPESSTDSVQITYELSGENTRDGEMRTLPVLPVGLEEHRGQYTTLWRDTAFQWAFDPAKGPVTVFANNSALDLLLKDIEYLRNYPYWCNEQTASRLLALLSLKKIKAAQQQPVSLEKDIQTCLKRLQNNQNADGSWGWWPKDAANWWMTLYVTDALSSAREAGYSVPFLAQTYTLLRLELPRMRWNDQIQALRLLRQNGSDKDCTPYLAVADTIAAHATGPDAYPSLVRLQLRQLCDQPVSRPALRTLLQPTTLGGLYCGEITTDWYNRRNTNTILAYQIAQKAGWSDLCDSIAQYWLQSRQMSYTTFEKAQIVALLSPVLLASKAKGAIPVLVLNGQQQTTFPVQIQINPQQVLSVEKTGLEPLYLTAYQDWFNAQPAPRDDVFAVKTRILDAKNAETTNLTYGTTATLEVQVTVKAAAEYLMLEVPIPAGCTYGEKTPATRPETHREYFKDHTAIFCTRLPVGNYTFRIPLEARFSGRFTLNPAKVAQMYFPVFYGNNGVGKLEIRRP